MARFSRTWRTDASEGANPPSHDFGGDNRLAEAFWYLDASGVERLLQSDLFHRAISALAQMREWRAIQIERNRVELQIEFLADADAAFDEAQFFVLLRASGLPETVRVDVELVIGLRPDKQSGTFRRMVSQLSRAM